MTGRTLGDRARLLIVTAAGVLALAGCSSGVHSSGLTGQGAVDSGGLTENERQAAQSALDELQNSNISFQVVSITKWVQSVPATCRIHLVSGNPATFEVYVFWIPWLAAEPYVWINMNVTNDPRASTFRLGAVQPVLAGWQAGAERSENQPGIDRHHLALSLRAATGQERPADPAGQRRRRLREARCKLPSAPEREPQARAEYVGVALLSCDGPRLQPRPRCSVPRRPAWAGLCIRVGYGCRRNRVVGC